MLRNEMENSSSSLIYETDTEIELDGVNLWQIIVAVVVQKCTAMNCLPPKAEKRMKEECSDYRTAHR